MSTNFRFNKFLQMKRLSLSLLKLFQQTNVPGLTGMNDNLRG